ncbi:MAG: NAD(P)H-dependent oxidoreductase subunit E [Chloroflexi bacterium]|nr:NAD(P)H-dependent oxidoreductase subunit E [Chloroflexota bacterium]
MLGILTGLKVTLQHIFKPKITQIYPYVKPQLPERSRGLIQLIREKETGVLKCEACLLCEKACPPRAITISYSERGGFRKRPLFRPHTVGGFYRARMARTAPYSGKLVPPAVDVPRDQATIDVTLVEAVIAKGQDEGWDVLKLLEAVQDCYGYIPEAAAERVSQVTGVAMSDLYSALTLSPDFHIKPTDSIEAAGADDIRSGGKDG